MFTMLSRQAILAYFMFVLGLYAVVPSRNVRGSPGMERELGRCTLSDGALIRLYRGEGNATVAFWYTVTHKPRRWGMERQIVFSYSEPTFSQVTCTSRGLALTDSDESLGVALSTNEARAMRWNPRQYWRGGIQYSKRVSIIGIAQVEGLVILFVAVALLKFNRPRNRDLAPAT
jgi:hypothetical protein